MQKLSKRMIVSAGIVPVRFVDGKPLFLMLRHNTYWDFPKGKQEDKESVFETAIRETQEETTLVEDDLDFKWGKVNKKSDTYKNGQKYAVYFVAETNVNEIGLPPNPEIGRPEHEEYAWFTLEEAQEVANDRIRKILNWAHEVVTS